MMATIAALGLLASAAAFACTARALIQLTPKAGTAATPVSVKGEGFSASMDASPVTLHWNSLVGDVVWTGQPAADGTLTATFVVPEAAPGDYVVIAQQTVDGRTFPMRAQFAVPAPAPTAPSPAPAPAPSPVEQPVATPATPPVAAAAPAPAPVSTPARAPAPIQSPQPVSLFDTVAAPDASATPVPAPPTAVSAEPQAQMVAPTPAPAVPAVDQPASTAQDRAQVGIAPTSDAGIPSWALWLLASGVIGVLGLLAVGVSAAAATRCRQRG